MKDRLQAALTALGPFVDDVLNAMEIHARTAGTRPSLGLWECPPALAERAIAKIPGLTVSARNDGRGAHIEMVKAGAQSSVLPSILHEALSPHLAANSASAGGVGKSGKDAAAIVFPVPSRELTFGLIAAASLSAVPGAPVLVAGTKDQGMSTILKRLKERGIEVEKRSKAHAIALRFTAVQGLLDDWLTACEPKEFESENGQMWTTAPGVFSHGRVDRGSLLLRKHLPELSRKVADFGGGWGALAPALLEKGAKRVDLFEASALAALLAKQNLAEIPDEKLSVHWHDLLVEQVDQTFDHIVMNPPFHTGKITSKNLGAQFIAVAHKALKPGGTLTLVANVHLGYEHVLAANFGNCQELARQDGFKILTALRRRR
ncbi:MAG: methyltransferase [Pseudomonadota bacterium]